MIAADLGRAAALATIPAAYELDALTMGQLYAVAFVVGTLSVLFYVSHSTVFVSIVPREQFVEGNSILNGTRAMSYVAGPSAGGILVQAADARRWPCWPTPSRSSAPPSSCTASTRRSRTRSRRSTAA